MPSTLNINPGQRFERLVIVKEAAQKNGRRMFLCLCDCGNKKIIALTKLRTGNTKSCGCFQRESYAKGTRTHGCSKTRIYYTWSGIKERCLRPSSTVFDYYGGRGITICEEWMAFEPFYEWAMANGYRDDLTIERVDNEGNYEPGNCKWIPKREQSNNTRRSLLISYKGQTKNLKQWSRELGLAYMLLYKRIRLRGWSAEKAFAVPSLAGRVSHD